MNCTAIAVGWVVLTAWAVLLGWVLSLAGCLNATGCLAGAMLTVIAMTVWWWRNGETLAGPWRWRRYRKGYPAIFLATWVLAVAGGFMHAPNNIDALTYRLPRVLHWLAEQHWHWIETNDPRMNYSATGMEWQMLPFLAVLRSDRLLFLLNAVPALLMPGLVFSFLRQAGVASRVAWRWMWLLPLAPVYALQAGSIANDALGALYFLAACRFLRLAMQRGGWHWAGAALLAAGLLTGIKASNLPLLLPLGVLMWPVRSRFMIRPVLSIGFALLALMVSAMPALALNLWQTGHWSGDPANVTEVRLTSPAAGLTGNAMQGLVQNVVPPVFPWARAWNEWSAARLEPKMRELMDGDFKRFSLRVGELSQEEWAGLGLPIILLLLGGFSGGRCGKTGVGPWLIASGVGAMLVFFAVMGSEMTARLLAPYYPVLMLLFLRSPGQLRWITSSCWHWLAAGVIGSTWLALSISPARPIFPMVHFAETWRQQGGGPLADRALTVYETYERRDDPLTALRSALPREATEVGFLGSPDDSEISLWRPYGQRHVQRLVRNEAPASPWVVLRADAGWASEADRSSWLTQWNAQLVKRELVRIKASCAPEEWWLVRVSPTGSGAGG